MMNLKKADYHLTGADVIVRKVLSFMTRQVSPASIIPPQTARNELPRLAHDDIGACKGTTK